MKKGFGLPNINNIVYHINNIHQKNNNEYAL